MPTPKCKTDITPKKPPRGLRSPSPIERKIIDEFLDFYLASFESVLTRYKTELTREQRKQVMGQIVYFQNALSTLKFLKSTHANRGSGIGRSVRKIIQEY